MSTENNYPEVHNLGIKIHFLIRKTRKDPIILPHLYKLCVTFRPDIIHTWDSMTSAYAIPIAKILGVKLVNGMIRDAPDRVIPFTKPWIRARMTFPFSDVIVANSLAGLRAYGAPRAKSVCIHNGFDFNRLHGMPDQDTVRRNFGIDTSQVVGMVASFSERKDYETYIAAAQTVLATRDDVTFVAVGDGKTLERCKSLVMPQYTQRVKFLGWQRNVESIINAMDIGVLATYTEGISNAILEFMALAKPVVATDGGAMNELVVDGVTGFLVPARDAGQLARRLTDLLCDAGRCRALGKHGRHRVLSLFGMETMASHFVRMYETLTVNEEES
jgi:glycosyltransferase involved in cell wall biosynthesis